MKLTCSHTLLPQRVCDSRVPACGKHWSFSVWCVCLSKLETLKEDLCFRSEGHKVSLTAVRLFLSVHFFPHQVTDTVAKSKAYITVCGKIIVKGDFKCLWRRSVTDWPFICFSPVLKQTRLNSGLCSVKANWIGNVMRLFCPAKCWVELLFSKLERCSWCWKVLWGLQGNTNLVLIPVEEMKSPSR